MSRNINEFTKEDIGAKATSLLEYPFGRFATREIKIKQYEIYSRN